jgi:hypothetical protein
MDPAHLRSPSLPIAEGHAVRRVAKIVAGWLLLLLGVAALALPGPGLLLLLAGLVVLSQEYDWAEKRVEPVKRAAFAAAAAGVRTVPRIAASAIGALALAGVGLLWGLDPTIPEFWIFGPKLPFAGWSTGTSLIVSSVIALGLLAWSVYRFGNQSPEAAREEATAGVQRPD